VSVGGEERRLVFVYHPFSVPTMAVVHAAQRVGRLIWVLDTTTPEVDLMAKLLRRLGDVVDVAGMSLDEAAAAIAAARPDGIVSLADSQLVWTADIAARLELPFLQAEAALNATDKYRQREALAAAGVAVPAHWIVPAPADAPGWALLEAQASFPAILKPREGSGSRDVVAVASLDELRARVGELSGRSGGRADGVAVTLMVEEYLGDREQHGAFGGYVSVESVVSDGVVSHLAITGRFPTTEPFRETGFFIPSALGGEERGAVLELAGAAVAAIGVNVGSVHTEIKLTPDGPRTIEVNARIGGSVVRMLPIATGVDPLELAMRIALGERIVFTEPPPCHGVTFMLYVQAPASMRRIVAVEGLDRLRAERQILELTLKRGAGRSVDSREGNHGHVFSVLGVVDDHEQLAMLERRVHAETLIRGE
jgi:biotin carboxylase